ncbi:L-type lectin-domain containing receptor kinase IX.1 [Thalictrum thalictroides]|uniref:L-type lectin-domain containing receptor kinase IX.1 n=1 Tax=Thalictrum thalictroides TaxID=46969 RepID=A0A7J6VLF6_THATH|nr:L-type lectin-domain containing receptor kinase IX.1 [Thalictrum thalictroides]
MSDVDPTFFSFPTFDHDSCAEDGDLICLGSAAAGDGYIDVTPMPQHTNTTSPPPLQLNTVGRILYRYPVLAWPATISTTFTVRISKDPNSIGSGDGMTFVMAEDNGPSPEKSYGAFLGLLNKTTKSGTQLGVEMDTYYNNEFDPDDNHIGIDTDRIASIATVSLNNIGVDLKLGAEVTVKINYNGWQKKLQIYAAFAGAPLVSVLNYTIIMEKTVPQSVYVGFTGSTGIVSESHQILNWVFNSVPLPQNSLNDGNDRAEKTKKILMITSPVVCGALVLAVIVYIMVKTCRKKPVKTRKGTDIESQTRSAANTPKMFSFKDLSKATLNFNKDNLLGTGGFGSVYRGFISDPPTTIAVKRISATSKQGEREFLAEICTIGRLRHKNIVQLQGWCHEGDHLLLVYEFMPNGSLDLFISKVFLDWQTRYKILTGLASALLYLHEECGSTVVHRDVKPNNVMLDSEYNACLGDFGLARFFQNEEAVTTILAGTPGYLAPECTYTGRATPESDIFSYGVVVLEVVCGRRCNSIIGQTNIVDYVWNLHGKGELLNCVDRKLEGSYAEEEIKRVLAIGLACSHPDPTLRPTMRKVIQVFMNPNEPIVDVPESRPSAIYVTVYSQSPSSMNILGSSTHSGSSSSKLSEETAP